MSLVENLDLPFVAPDFASPLNLAERLQICPPDAVTKGIFFDKIVNALKVAGHDVEGRSYLGFKSYSQREFIKLAAFAAPLLYPECALREGLRRLGHDAYLTFTNTLVGKIMFGVLGNEIEQILPLAESSYPKVTTPGNIRYEVVGDCHSRVYLREIYALADSYQIGVWEGAFLACKISGRVLLRRHSLCDVDFDLTWDKPRAD